MEAYERRIKKKAAKTLHTIKGSIPSKGQMQQHTKQTVREIKVRKINYALGKHFLTHQTFLYNVIKLNCTTQAVCLASSWSSLYL